MAILIVDDEPDMRTSLRFVLEVHGHQDIHTCSNGREAVEFLATSPTAVDLILTDISMPSVTGIDLCRFVKESPHLHDIPVVMITALMEEPVLERAFAAGAHDFLPKPVGPTELVARVGAALNLKRELDRRRLRENELVDLTRRLERTNDKLRRLSVLDELTGIPNRRYFNLLLQQEWGRAAREKQPLSLVMIDVDHFKSFNDLYGHPAGDACLTRVARTLFSLIRRTSDSVCRFGGEEFVALLANTDLAGASVVAEGFRKAVEEVARAHLGSPHQHVTVSLGVACTVPEVEGASDDLLHAADEALYRAKATGRNRVEVADELAAAAADSTVV